MCCSLLQFHISKTSYGTGVHRAVYQVYSIGCTYILYTARLKIMELFCRLSFDYIDYKELHNLKPGFVL